MLGLAGLEATPSMNGRDLTPLLRGDSPPWRSEWFYEHLFEHPRIPKSEGVRSANWKYFCFFEQREPNEFLYDLGADSGEIHNLAQADRQPQLERLRTRKQAWAENLEAWKIDQAWREPEPGPAM
jgi:arylsulfatase A-like enzyme